MIAYFLSVFFTVLAVALAISSRQAMHALLYLLFGLVALSLNLSLGGNGFGAVLLMIVYAGAIMVLFVFVVMLLNKEPSRAQVTPLVLVKQIIGPLVYAIAIFSFLVFVQIAPPSPNNVTEFSIKTISVALFRDGWFFVEMLSLLLTAALVGAFHIGKRRDS